MASSLLSVNLGTLELHAINDADLLELLAGDPQFPQRATRSLYRLLHDEESRKGQNRDSMALESLTPVVMDRLRDLRAQVEVERRVAAERVEDARRQMEGQLRAVERERDLLKQFLEQERALSASRTTNASRMTERGKEGEATVLSMLHSILGSTCNHKDILNMSEAVHESDMHVVDTKTNKRVAIEVKNYGGTTSRVLTVDVNKAVSDVAYLHRKYGPEFIGYIFISLRGGHRIPNKGYVSMEVISGVPVLWLSCNIDEDYQATQSLLNKMLLLIDSLDANKVIPSLAEPDADSAEAVNPAEATAALETAVQRWQAWWQDELRFLNAQIKNLKALEKQVLSMRKELSGRLLDPPPSSAAPLADPQQT